MKKLLILLFFITSVCYGQEVEIGNIFTIEFSNPEKNMDYEIVSQRPYHSIMESSNIDSVLKHNPTKNQIVGVFAKGAFGDNVGSMLVLISGLSNNLNYDLEIALLEKSKFQKTSTSVLLKGVKSMEYWPNTISKINFKGFKVGAEKKPAVTGLFEIDSTCLKNADRNIKLGEQEFKSYFKSIVEKFKSNNKFQTGQVLKYQKSINSKNVSLGHFWSLGESIYPNKKRFTFGTPLSFKGVECPYFESTSHYFYTKVKGNIKVVSFEWETFKAYNLLVNPENKDITPKFIEKYNFLVYAISQLLGKPLATVQKKDSGRIDTKWRSKDAINAYLFRFADYNNIRLYIYKE